MQAENQTERELTEMLTAKELLGRAQALEPQLDRKSTRLNSSHPTTSRMPSSA